MSNILKYAEHSGRLSNVALLVRFTTGAIGRHERSLPNDENYIRAKEEITDAYRMLLASLVNPPELDSAEVKEEIREAVDKVTIVAEPSRTLVYNLCFVLLVTQIEIFIEHLIDVILAAEPRRLKDLAGEKNLTVAELVDLRAYDAVMKRLREKVSKEVIDSSPYDMFVKHLGKRFGLFRKQDELVLERPQALSSKKRWGIADIEAVWETRHKIVHEGHLPVDKDIFESTLAGFLWLEAFLSIQACRKYELTVDSPEFLRLCAGSGTGLMNRIFSAFKNLDSN